jgi:hypothetical protein
VTNSIQHFVWARLGLGCEVYWCLPKNNEFFNSAKNNFCDPNLTNANPRKIFQNTESTLELGGDNYFFWLIWCYHWTQTFRILRFGCPHGMKFLLSHLAIDEHVSG